MYVKKQKKIRINSACAHVLHRRSQSLNLLLIALFIISVYFGVNSKLFMKNGKIVEKEAVYRDRLKGLQILLSNSQAGPGRKVKQEQEEISREPRTSLFADLCTEFGRRIPYWK